MRSPLRQVRRPLRSEGTKIPVLVTISRRLPLQQQHFRNRGPMVSQVIRRPLMLRRRRQPRQEQQQQQPPPPARRRRSTGGARWYPNGRQPPSRAHRRNRRSALLRGTDGPGGRRLPFHPRARAGTISQQRQARVLFKARRSGVDYRLRSRSRRIRPTITERREQQRRRILQTTAVLLLFSCLAHRHRRRRHMPQQRRTRAATTRRPPRTNRAHPARPVGVVPPHKVPHPWAGKHMRLVLLQTPRPMLRTRQPQEQLPKTRRRTTTRRGCWQRRWPWGSEILPRC
jgi:hypothetical protein